MILINLQSVKEWFAVSQTRVSGETGETVLAPGPSSTDDDWMPADADQLVLLLEGEVAADIEGETRRMRIGDVVFVPAAARHRFVNLGAGEARTYRVAASPGRRVWSRPAKGV